MRYHLLQHQRLAWLPPAFSELPLSVDAAEAANVVRTGVAGQITGFSAGTFRARGRWCSASSTLDSLLEAGPSLASELELSSPLGPSVSPFRGRAVESRLPKRHHHWPHHLCSLPFHLPKRHHHWPHHLCSLLFHLPKRLRSGGIRFALRITAILAKTLVHPLPRRHSLYRSTRHQGALSTVGSCLFS